jgi:hypothetical protein
MAGENPLWRAPRIHGELKMLGIVVSERTVSRILRTLPRSPSQSWKTFLNNHVGQILSVYFFTVPTITLKVLYVFVVLAHRRRELLQFNVTDHPTAEWIAQQVVEACAYRDTPKYLIRDRDRVYGSTVRERLQSVAHSRSAYCTSKPLAELLCGTADWIDSTRMPEPRRDSKCPASQANAHFVLRLLSAFENAFSPGKGLPDHPEPC